MTAPRAERRIVTCLFVDIVGSTDLTVSLGPERMQRLLSGAFDELSAIVTGHGGIVEKFIGDAMFALFGAPTAHADDPLRALRAAEACADRARLRPREQAIAIRVGVETGEVLVDLDAMNRERQRRAVGACVNVAARLQQQADPGEILVGPICHDAVVGSAEFETAGALALKGVGDVAAWRLVRTTGAPRAALPFVGRQKELQSLRAAFDHARAGGAGRAMLIGPPGQGKTRLAQEFVRPLRENVRVLEARCRPAAETTVRPPIHQLLASDVAGEGGGTEIDTESVVARVRSLLQDAAESLHVASVLCHSAGVSVDEKLLSHMPRDLQEEFVLGWRRYLEALARERPLLLHLED